MAGRMCVACRETNDREVPPSGCTPWSRVRLQRRLRPGQCQRWQLLLTRWRRFERRSTKLDKLFVEAAAMQAQRRQAGPRVCGYCRGVLPLVQLSKGSNAEGMNKKLIGKMVKQTFSNSSSDVVDSIIVKKTLFYLGDIV